MQEVNFSILHTPCSKILPRKETLSMAQKQHCTTTDVAMQCLCYDDGMRGNFRPPAVSFKI